MKIILSNKFYYRRGGDCIYVMNLERLLVNHGHEVAVFAMDYKKNVDTPYKKYFPSYMQNIKVLTRPFGDKEVQKKFLSLVNDFKPDIVHLNNIHTQLSPLIGRIAHKKNIKVVWTLHDYKLLCPRYDCMRNGKTACEKCFIDKHNVLKYSCMKNNKLASIIAYKEANKWNREKIESFTDEYICPSVFMVEKMAQGGFNPNKLVHLCNFIDIEKCKRNDYNKGNYYCYIGRLSHEKGIETLIKAANDLPHKLVVVGRGPLADKLKTNAKNNIEFVGFKDWDDIKELVGNAKFIVIPSEWYENNPLSVIEAECLGTPVLGANIGGIPELINENINGMTFESGNVVDLKSKIEIMWNTSFDYEKIANISMEYFNAEKYYIDLIKIYNGKK